MKFTKLIVIFAISALAVSAGATEDGSLGGRVLPADQPQVEDTTTTTTKEVTKEVNININTNQQPSHVEPTAQQPTTNVEAQPAEESKAEALRRERQKAEVQTEQKIEEKLEDSRLQEEKARADRLFGNKLDPQQPAPPPAPIPEQRQVVAPLPPPPVQDNKPTEVRIEKVEIVQPVQQVEPRREELRQEEPAAESRTALAKDDDAEPVHQKYYVGVLGGDLNYNASNVKSNYGLGVMIGTIIDERWALELSYMYSNSNIADLWQSEVFHTMNQSDISAAAKYYLLPGKLKPYIGGDVSYINRQYTDYIGSYGYGYGATSAEATNAVDMGVLGGVDYAITDSFMLGAGADYNFNVMTTNDINFASYNLPEGSQSLEKMSYWTLKLTAKFVF